LIPVERLQRVIDLPLCVAAERLAVSRSTLKRWRRRIAGSARRGLLGKDDAF
jgi:hypothetical protein